MTQDCLNSLSTVDAGKRLPNGINIIGADRPSAPKVEGTPQSEHPVRRDPSKQPTSWSYLFLQHMAARTFRQWLEAYNAEGKNLRKQPFFIHQTFRYTYRNKEEQSGVKKTLEPSVSGLIFLQGTVRGLQRFLSQYFPQYHLVKDRCHGRPASISDSVMQPFMNVMKTHPEQVTFLRDPFETFARNRVKLRVLTGPFRGCEGYIVRIDRNRQLVFDFGGYAVAIRGVHKEDFEEVEE